MWILKYINSDNYSISIFCFCHISSSGALIQYRAIFRIEIFPILPACCAFKLYFDFHTWQLATISMHCNSQLNTNRIECNEIKRIKNASTTTTTKNALSKNFTVTHNTHRLKPSHDFMASVIIIYINNKHNRSASAN